ncbi:MAG: TPM domain-containing protein [Akkermansiaceae bacterium]|nr:TPM domain-containing protein [Akkermansiaceae bacterium]
MKCPRCVQKIHPGATSCPHCGFAMEHADEAFGTEDIKLKKFSDVAGVFRMKDREPMRKVLENFETKFPQLFVSIYLSAFEDLNSLRQYGFWMLNRTNYVDVDSQRPNATGILILVDVNAKSASITYGYALMPYLDENSTFAALSAGHPMFLQGDYPGALRAVIQKLEALLIKGWRRVSRDPVTVLAAGGQKLKDAGPDQGEIRVAGAPSGTLGEVEG